MISLDVENYCQECEKFEPECIKMYSDGSACLTLISCTNKGVCANLKQYLEGQMARKERPDYMATCVNKWEDANEQIRKKKQED